MLLAGLVRCLQALRRQLPGLPGDLPFIGRVMANASRESNQSVRLQQLLAAF